MSDQTAPAPAPVLAQNEDQGTSAIADVVSELPAVVKESKEGYKTTEFWLSVIGLLAVNLNGVVLTLPDKYQAIASAVLVGLYGISRGLAKKGVPVVEPADPAA